MIVFVSRDRKYGATRDIEPRNYTYVFLNEIQFLLLEDFTFLPRNMVVGEKSCENCVYKM